MRSPCHCGGSWPDDHREHCGEPEDVPQENTGGPMSGAPKQDHTPTPWSAPGNGNVVGADGTLVTAVPRPKGAGASARRDANVRLIVEAVNAHASGVGELIAERNHAHREYVLHKSLATGQVDSLIAELAEVKAARPSRETVDKLVAALRESLIYIELCERHDVTPSTAGSGFLDAQAALSAYESETKR